MGCSREQDSEPSAAVVIGWEFCYFTNRQLLKKGSAASCQMAEQRVLVGEVLPARIC
jgi:hypothetical protein